MIPNILSTLKPEFLREIGADHFKMGRSCRVLVITGENAGGKSFLRRVFMGFLKQRKPPIGNYTFSMESRSRSALDGNIMMGMAYGDETYYATSFNTVHALRSILSTSERDTRDHRHVIILDEPEIGLSEETEMAVGLMMRDHLSRKWPRNRAGVIAMTHSRHIVRALMGIRGATFLNLFDRYPTADAWLEREIAPTDLDALEGDAVARFRRLTEMLREK